MTDLIAKLRVALDEDERVALDAAAEVGDGHWEQRNVRIVTAADRDREVADYAILECIDHMLRHDPARVLRQVAAMRKILDEHIAYNVEYDARVIGDDDHCVGCGFDSVEEYRTEHIGQCPTLLALAEAYGIEVQT